MNFPIYSFSFQEWQAALLPSELWNIPSAPQRIFVQGSPQALELLKQLPQFGLAIVGTRNPTPRSLAFVKARLMELKNSNLIIISGLALGIDAMAHQAALDSGLPTIGVLAGGFNQFYPPENESLREKILESHGLLISEFSPDTPVRGFQFLKRNRIIAAWSQCTCVIEAGYRSGALNTARWARDLHKTCLTVPCFPNDSAYAGNQILLDRDHALCFWSVQSLGAVWLNLATSDTLFSQKKNRISSQAEKKLISQIRKQTLEQGGISTHLLLNWALSQNWSASQYFKTLQDLIQKKFIFEHQGFIVSY